MFFLISKVFYFITEFRVFLFLNFLVVASTTIIIFYIYKSQRSRKEKKIILSLVAALLFAAMMFTFAEAYFRFVYDKSDGLGFLKVNQNWRKRHVTVNGDFRRDREFTLHKTPDRKRVCAIGDSITFGYGIENPSDRYTDILEKILRNEGYDVEIYNLAVSGANFKDTLSNYHDHKYLNCDIVMSQYSLNDIRDNEEQAKLLQEYADISKFTRKITDFSYFLDFLYWRASQRYEASFKKLQEIDFQDYQNKEKLTSHLSEIAEFTKEVKSNNSKIIVVIFPMLYSTENYPGWIHTLAEAQFKRQGAVVVDLLPLAVGKNLKELRASQFDAHPNEYFHLLAAQEIYEPLRSMLNN